MGINTIPIEIDPLCATAIYNTSLLVSICRYT